MESPNAVRDTVRDDGDGNIISHNDNQMIQMTETAMLSLKILRDPIDDRDDIEDLKGSYR